MMKTSEEIKKGLECCENPNGSLTICGECPYYGAKVNCIEQLYADTRKYIHQIEAELEAVKLERDAAVKDLSMGLRCNACKKFFKNNNNVGCSGGLYCIPFRFEWRGVCPENTEVQEDA